MSDKQTNTAPMTDREALVYVLGQFDAEIFVCPACTNEEPTKEMDSAHFLRRHLAEVPAHLAPTVPHFKFATLVEHCKRLETQLAAERSRNNDLEFYRDDNAVWHWQNDGQDFLESLSCPVIIPAHQLRAFLLENTHGGFTKRLSDLADKMSVIVNKTEAEAASLRTLLANLVDHVDSTTCQHDSTHRGGVIWTICDDCGKKWADDRGGFVPYTDDQALSAARTALEPVAAPVPDVKPAPRCNSTLLIEGKPRPRTCAKCGLGPCSEDAQ